jgi:FMN phosphatase YigB (HAD superfamily)
MDELFDAIITYDDVLELKPSIKGFKMVTDMLDVKKEECLMVGDNPDRDVIGAKKFGMKICLARYERELKADVDYVINDIEELISIVKEN